MTAYLREGCEHYKCRKCSRESKVFDGYFVPRFELFRVLVLNNVFISQKIMYRYLNDGCWCPESEVTALYKEYEKLRKEADPDTMFKIDRPFIHQLVGVFFIGGRLGLELANMYTDFPNDLTAVKLKLIGGKNALN